MSAEVGVRFDRTRVAELPVRASRNVFALALSAPGVTELASGQTEFAGENRTGFSSNGMRLRSNNFMIDGQDNNDLEREQPSPADQQHRHRSRGALLPTSSRRIRPRAGRWST